MSEIHDVAILGASGYTGAELVRLIATHPGLRIAALTADRKAGQAMGEVFPHLRHLDLPMLTTIDAIDFADDRPRLLRPAARHHPGGDRRAARATSRSSISPPTSACATRRSTSSGTATPTTPSTSRPRRSTA